MEEILNKLKPIEKLYLKSKEEEEIYTNKNKLMYLLNYLYENRFILISKNGNKFKVRINDKNQLQEYELKFLKLLLEKKYKEIFEFIKILQFDEKLIKLSIIAKKIKQRKIFFYKYEVNEMDKTKLYYMIQEQLKNYDYQIYNSVMLFYSFLKNKIQQEYKKINS